MNAIQQDAIDACAEADAPALLIQSVTEGVRDGRRKSARLTIAGQDKLRERIAVLESRLRYGWTVVVASFLIGALVQMVVGK